MPSDDAGEAVTSITLPSTVLLAVEMTFGLLRRTKEGILPGSGFRLRWPNVCPGIYEKPDLLRFQRNSSHSGWLNGEAISCVLQLLGLRHADGRWPVRVHFMPVNLTRMAG